MSNLDVLIAEKIFDLIPCDAWEMYCKGDCGHGEGECFSKDCPPPYSKNLFLAWQIDRPEWNWQFYEDEHELSVEIVLPEPGCYSIVPAFGIPWDIADTKAGVYCLARCRAALEAVGVEWEGEDES